MPRNQIVHEVLAGLLRSFATLQPETEEDRQVNAELIHQLTSWLQSEDRAIPAAARNCVKRFVDSELDWTTPGGRGLGRTTTLDPRFGGKHRAILQQAGTQVIGELHRLFTDHIFCGYLMPAYFFECLTGKPLPSDLDVARGDRLFHQWIPLIFSPFGSSQFDEPMLDYDKRYGAVKNLWVQAFAEPIADCWKRLNIAVGHQEGRMLGNYFNAGITLRLVEARPLTDEDCDYVATGGACNRSESRGQEAKNSLEPPRDVRATVPDAPEAGTANLAVGEQAKPGRPSGRQNAHAVGAYKTDDAAHWIVCPECGGEIGIPCGWRKQAVVCPNCRKETILTPVMVPANSASSDSSTQPSVASAEQVPVGQVNRESSMPPTRPTIQTAEDALIVGRDPPLSTDSTSSSFKSPSSGTASTPELRRVSETPRKAARPPFAYSTTVARAQPKSPDTNGYAVTGLCLGIASVFLYVIGILPLLAIVFSGIGLAKASQRNGKGAVQASIGLVLGIIFMLMNFLLYHAR